MADTASSPSSKHSLLQRRLSKRQYNVTQLKKNEPAFTGALLNEQADGEYCCIVCESRLFESSAKFEFESGWPSFNQPAAIESIRTEERLHLGIVRSEVMCAGCDAFLGHVEPDSDQPTGQRYSINSASMKFKERK